MRDVEVCLSVDFNRLLLTKYLEKISGHYNGYCKEEFVKMFTECCISYVCVKYVETFTKPYVTC